MKIRVDRRRWFFAIVNLALAALTLVSACLLGCVTGTLDSVRAAERWRGDNEMRFAQIACFLPVDDLRSEADVLSFRSAMEQAFVDASLETPEGTSLYADAYSGTASVTVSTDHGSATVKAIGVGGDFFLFHPLQLRSGSYISGSDFMQDRVVLDEELAWQLFGSPDVAGMEVMISGKPYYVAGVISREDDFATGEAYTETAGMFISFDALYALTEVGISCYEVVLPDMITGFGYDIVEKNFPIGRGEIVENSARYSLKHLLQVAGNFGKRSMRENGVIYPYWENAARLTEDYAALLLVLCVLFALCPAISLLVLVIRLIVRGYRWGKRRIPEKVQAAVERKKEENYAKAGE